MSNELNDVVKSAIIEVLEPFQDLVMKRFDGIEHRLDGFEHRLDRIEHRLDLIEQKQDLIIDQVVQNSEDITIIKETVIQIVQTQQNQHRIIELLAVRSIEQEAALKRVI